MASVIVIAVGVTVATAHQDHDYSKVISQSNAKEDLQLLASGDSALDAADNEKALMNYMLLCGRADSTMTSARMKACIEAHVKAGDIYYGSGDYTNALDFYLRGLELSDKTTGNPYIALLYKNLGNVYNMYDDHEQAIRQYQEALKYCTNDSVLTLRLFNNLVRTYVMANDLTNAAKYHKKTVAIHCGNATEKFLVDFNYSLLLQEEKRYDEAIERLKKSAAYARQNRLEARYEASAYEILYKAYANLEMRDSVLAYMNRCKELVIKENLIRLFTDIYRDMADFYEKEGHTGNALQLRSQYLHVRDSIFNIRRFDMLKNQQLMYETDKVQRELREQKERERRHSEIINWQWTVIIIVLLAAITVGCLLVNVYRKKRKLDSSYRNLYKINRQYADNYRKATEHERGLVKDIESAMLRIEELEKAIEMNSAQPVPIDNAEKSPDETHQEKYSSSRLDKARHSELLGKISHVMEDEKAYCNDDFSLNTLASMVGSNSRYVSQIINEAYGKNFNNYVNEFRIRLACERFADIKNYGHLTIQAIGESVGFKSHTAFLSFFKKMTGMTPSVYSRLAKEQEENNS